MNGAHVFSHLTAAVLWGMPLPSHLDIESLHVSAQAPARAPSGRGITGHSLRLMPASTRWLGGFPVLAPAETWRLLAEVLAAHDLVCVGDFIVTGNPWRQILPLATIDELTLASRSRSAFRGSRLAIEALHAVRVGPLSRPESLLRQLVLAAGLPEPVLNGTIATSSGSFVAMPDLGWPDYHVAAEYEGDHHRGRGQFRHDIRRVELIIDQDWSVVRVSADDLFDRPSELVTRLGARLTARGWEGRVDLRHIGHFRR